MSAAEKKIAARKCGKTEWENLEEYDLEENQLQKREKERVRF